MSKNKLQKTAKNSFSLNIDSAQFMDFTTDTIEKIKNNKKKRKLLFFMTLLISRLFVNPRKAKKKVFITDMYSHCDTFMSIAPKSGKQMQNNKRNE